jgi:hypothetical protein
VGTELPGITTEEDLPELKALLESRALKESKRKSLKVRLCIRPYLQVFQLHQINPS